MLAVRANWVEGRVENLAVELRRPTVTRLFIGQLPDAVVKTVPYLYTLCAEAQRTAAQCAVAAARGESPLPADDRALWLELLHENLWRLLLDWPSALGLAKEKDAFIEWRAERQGDKGLAVTQRVLANTLRPLSEKCLERLGCVRSNRRDCVCWHGMVAKARGAGNGCSIPEPSNASDRPCQQTRRASAWRGALPRYRSLVQITARRERRLALPPRETLAQPVAYCEHTLMHRSSAAMPVTGFDAEGWLAFWRGEADHRPAIVGPSCVAAAYRARLADVERAVAALAERAPYPIVHAGGQGWGVGQVLTARGVLTHAIHVVEGLVANYRVQAPTDGFFANAAPLAALLVERTFADAEAARQGIEQAILALDPCLPYELVVCLANSEHES